MAKPTDFQKRVIEAVVNEVRWWANSNDIHSPSHYTSIEYEMFSNLDEWDTPTVMNDGLEDVVLMVEKLFTAISKLEKK